MNIENLNLRYPHKRYWVEAAITAAGTLAGAATSAAGQSSLNKKTREFNKEQAEIQRNWSEKMYNDANAWNYEMWQRENAYNTPEAQLKRLRDAGLNPMYFGLDGSSAGALSAAQPLGYERAEISNQPNPLASFGSLGSGVSSAIAIQKEIDLKNAQIDKLKEDTKSVGLDNEWKDKTMDARAESEQLKNEALRSDIRLKKQDLSNKVQEFAKLAAETDNEIARHGYILAQTALNNAMKKKTDEETATIVALRPLEIQLKQAQTEAQRASAAAQYANALYTNGLVDAGYIDKQVELIASQCQNYKELAKTQEAQRFMTEFKNSIKSGSLFDFLNGYQPRGKFGQFVADFGSSFFQFMSIAGEAISSVPGASSAFGGALGAAAGSSSSSSGLDYDTVQKQSQALGAAGY